MPPLPVIANVYRVALTWTGGSGALSAANVMHFKAAVSGTTTPDLHDALEAHVTRSMWDMCGDGAQVIKYTITPLDGSTASSDYVPGTSSHWQGSTGGDLVPQVAGLMKFQTGIRGRSARGRIFFPFPAEGQVAFGQYIDGTPALATAAWETFTNDMIANDPSFALVVASYKHATAEQVLAVHAEISSATQRRRNTRARLST